MGPVLKTITSCLRGSGQVLLSNKFKRELSVLKHRFWNLGPVVLLADWTRGASDCQVNWKEGLLPVCSRFLISTLTPPSLGLLDSLASYCERPLLAYFPGFLIHSRQCFVLFKYDFSRKCVRATLF